MSIIRPFSKITVAVTSLGLMTSKQGLFSMFTLPVVSSCLLNEPQSNLKVVDYSQSSFVSPLN